jgi:hypothetical protein
VELLYVVELEIRPAEESREPEIDVRERVLEHAASWLSHDRSPQVSADAFTVPGSITLASDFEDRTDLRIEWRKEGTERTRALVLSVRTEISRSGRADFICRVTVLAEGRRVTARIELARESLDGVLAPSGIDFFRRPSLVGLLLRDTDLDCRVGSKRIDGRFEWVNPKHVDSVWADIVAEDRELPVLLVDAREEAGVELARRAAAELAGLSRVLAVDGRSQRLLYDGLAEIDAAIPGGGARLIWPDLTLRHPSFGRDEARYAVSRLLRMLSAVSVTVRGVNHLLRTAAGARRAEREGQFAAELAAARVGGDLSREVEAQTRVIEELRDENRQYESWFREVEEERDSFKTQAAQAAYWKQEAERARQAGGVRSTNWDEAPELDPYDLADLARFLEKESRGAIVFTREAHSSWKRAAYPRVEAMHDALVTLAQAATEYRRVGCQLGMVPDEWFKIEWELNLASTDKYMAANGMDTFNFDGDTYSRLPHLKLGDHTSPNEVGRVYFAMDSENERFIVDHVGLKLYGL